MKYYYMTNDGKKGKVGRRDLVPSNACILIGKYNTKDLVPISAPSDPWLAPAYIYAVLPDARIGRTLKDAWNVLSKMA